MQSGIIKMVVQMLWVKIGLFVRLRSTLKPFSILTQYCYVKLSALISESELFSERSNKF